MLPGVGGSELPPPGGLVGLGSGGAAVRGRPGGGGGRAGLPRRLPAGIRRSYCGESPASGCGRAPRVKTGFIY